MTEKRGRGRPKGAPNKPLMKLDTERKVLLNTADAFEILCQADIVAQEDTKLAVQGLQVFGQKNGSIKPLLQWIYDSNINSTLPEGTSPYTANPAPATDLAETSLRFEHKLFKYFVTEQVPMVKREAMWIGMLEGIPKNEAILVDLVKDGKWPFKNITKEIAKLAFSDINI